MRLQLRLKLIILFLIAFIVSAVAQQDKTLFLMHELPQANIVNPAVGIKCRFYVSIPLLSSIHLNYSNTLASVNDVIVPKPGTDSLKLDLQNAVNQTHNVDLINVEAHITLLEFGYQWETNYLSFAIRERASFFGTASQDLIQLGYYGNSHFLDQTANLGNVRGIGIHYREYSLGFSKDVSKKLRLGIHGKLLFGKAGTTTTQYSGGLYTDPVTFAISTSANYSQKVSAPIDIFQNPDGSIDSVALQQNINWVDYAFNRQNIGFAFDFGAIYKYNSKITLSASLLDLGTIFWKTNSNNLHTSGNYSFQGEVNGSGSSNSITDSIRSAYVVTLGEGPYFANLIPRLYLGGTYQFAPHFNTGATFYSELLMNKIHSSFGLSLNTQGFKKYSASLLWSAQNSQYTNIGLGFGAKWGDAHFHLISDNVPAFFKPQNARNINLRLGLNLLLGCKAKVIKKPAALPCPNRQLASDENFKKVKYKPINRQKAPKR